MNSKNWNDRADKDLFFTILSVKNIGVISGSEWTTIGNHMRSLGYGFTNEGCRQHFQGLRRAQNKAETAGPNGDIVRRNDPTMNPITRRPGPGRGRPRKQPPVPVPGAGEIPTDHQPMPVGIVPGPNPVTPYPHPHPHPQAVQSYGVPPGNHQAVAHLPTQPAAQPGSISPAIPTQQVPPPSNVPHVQGPITYPSPPRAPDAPHAPASLHPLQHAQSGQPDQQLQPEQQPPPGQQLQSEFQPQPDQQDEPEQASQLTVQPQPQPQPEQENSTKYQSQDVSQEVTREARETTDASAASQHVPVEQNDENSQAALTSEPLQHPNEDIDADGDADGDADADGEADIDNEEPAAKRPRLSSPEPPKDTDMDDEAVLALAAHNGSTDFGSDFATYGEA
ncbi:hypothetical protein FANTH_3758 [Fusarium anthophilum]|uniref:Myb-like domain-containing protein n=1 Tax=Fusarium anthophilum TaxID=48485 RepID=A0A8H4ZR21_9HYPO|nr:hypothetical protein FANTH_3758 [Fusarium anthophilum]